MTQSVTNGMVSVPVDRVGFLKYHCRVPIYEYRCCDCGAQFEFLALKRGEKPDCAKCGGKRLERLMSACSVQGSSPPSSSSSSCSTCGSSSCSSCGSKSH